MTALTPGSPGGGTSRGKRPAGITFRSAPVFWAGTAACAAGVLLHLPMYIGARNDGYRLAGMQPDAAMLAGMTLVVAGLIMSVYGLIPKPASGGGKELARARVT